MVCPSPFFRYETAGRGKRGEKSERKRRKNGEGRRPLKYKGASKATRFAKCSDGERERERGMAAGMKDDIPTHLGTQRCLVKVPRLMAAFTGRRKGRKREIEGERGATSRDLITFITEQ